ncbi:beta-Ig-H3/fasciclin, partial [Pelagophyceae sp. CCMP2097]
QPAPLKDIVDTAISAGTFTTLVAAVAAVGLVDTLKSAGPFTVFAPTDDAFALLPTGTVESLLLPENKAKLAGILTYHVLNGAVDASTAISLDGADVPTINGATLRVSVVNGALFVNDAQVIVADVLASNGIIHVIDAVLMPPAL